MLSVLASGVLLRDPQRRTAANGREFATARLRVPVEDAEPLIVSVIAFSESAIAALLALSQGDSCSIAGRAKLSEWTGQDGEQKHGLSIVADRVLSPYAAGKIRKASRERELELEPA